MRLTTDLFAYCAQHLPQWNTISISGYHMREAGATASQELAFTLANAIAYVDAAREAGLAIDAFAPHLSFFLAVFSDLFEEVAKFRALRRMWAQLMRDRYHAQDPRSLMLRFHAQTGGSTLTAQQPHNNIVRVALQALSAVLGGAQSLHACSFDEALGLPSEHAALLSLRTQQILAEETGVVASVDPLGGSYLVESLTDRLQADAEQLLRRIEAMGGAVAAIERGFIQGEIQESAYRQQLAVERGARVVVGVNRYPDADAPPVEIVKLPPGQQATQVEAVRKLRARRDAAAVRAHLHALQEAARGTGNLLPPMKQALAAYATVGEVCDTLRAVFGEYRAEQTA
jgi:methylmalonyl-CoA mutase N-terminal domain/subunit